MKVYAAEEAARPQSWLRRKNNVQKLHEIDVKRHNKWPFYV
jgi:hypothetical protein